MAGRCCGCGARGARTAILDLTQGEAGTRGSADERAAEAAAAGEILGLAHREALDLPDGSVENTYENRVKIVRVLRALRPRVVILPYWAGRHPDHYRSSTLGYEACFLSGLARLGTFDSAGTAQQAHRPFKIVYASLYADVRPSFVVDITPYMEERHRALMAYGSQYAEQAAGSGLFVPEQEIRERTFAEARHYGLLAGGALWGAVRAEGSWVGGGFDPSAGAIDLGHAVRNGARWSGLDCS